MIAAINYNVCLNRNGYEDRMGRRQVVVDLYQQGCRRVVNTGVKVEQRHFACGRIQPSHPDHDLLNRRVRRVVRRLMEIEDEMLDAGHSPTPDSLARAYRNNASRSATIEEWVQSVIAPSARRESTKENYRTLTHSLNTFHPGLCIGEVTYDLVERWRNWMRTDQRLCENTIANRLKTLHCLVAEAIRRDIISAQQDPFRHIRIPEIKARREHLTEQQVETLRQATVGDERQAHVRDAFLFCCYTGLRWSDFRRLSSQCLAAGILTVRQQKTGRTVQIPLASLWQGRALELIHQYGTLEHLADIGDNKTANDTLRKVAQAAGITLHLHWHLARHTCATLLNQQGLRMQEIQFILGHTKLAITERHYAETTLDQVEKSLQKAFT